MSVYEVYQTIIEQSVAYALETTSEFKKEIWVQSIERFEKMKADLTLEEAEMQI